ARTAVVSCAAISLGTTQATWASLSCAQTPHRTIGRGPRLAVELPHEEFLRVLPAFVAAYTACYPLDKTWQGTVRQRKVGGGAKGLLSQMEDKLLFILVYQKTNPLQTIHGL